MNYFYNYCYYYYYHYYYYYYYFVIIVVVVVVVVVVDDDTSWFTCPSTIHFKFLTKCDKCHYKVRQLLFLQSVIFCYYKVRQLFITSAAGITKCDRTWSHQSKPMFIYPQQFAPTD